MQAHHGQDDNIATGWLHHSASELSMKAGGCVPSGSCGGNVPWKVPMNSGRRPFTTWRLVGGTGRPGDQEWSASTPNRRERKARRLDIGGEPLMPTGPAGGYCASCCQRHHALEPGAEAV